MPNYKKGGMSGMRNATEGQVMPRTQFGGPPKEIWESALQTRSLVKRARNEVTSLSASFSDSRMRQPCCALQARARGEKLDDDSEEDDEPQPEPKRVFSEAESSGRETSRRKEVSGPRRAPNPLRQTCHPSRARLPTRQTAKLTPSSARARRGGRHNIPRVGPVSEPSRAVIRRGAEEGHQGGRGRPPHLRRTTANLNKT